VIQVPQKWQFLLQHFRNICTKNLTLWVHVQRKVASKQTRKHMQIKKHSSHDLNNGRHHLTQAVQSFPVSSEEGPSLHRDPISQNPQPTFKTIWNSSKNGNYYSKLVCTRTGNYKNIRKNWQECILIPFPCSWGSSDIYARGSPLMDKESKFQASLASCNQ
jgi:hypothetical protein